MTRLSIYRDDQIAYLKYRDFAQPPSLKPGLWLSKVRAAIERWAAVTRRGNQSRVRRSATRKLELMSGQGECIFSH